MEPLPIRNTRLAQFFLGENVERVGDRIDHRRGGDSDPGDQIGASEIGRRHWRDSIFRIDETRMPKRRARLVGVERIDAVELGRDKDNVVHVVGHLQRGVVERLRINVAVNGIGEEQTERAGLHRRGSQDGLGKILAGPKIIVAESERPGERRSKRLRVDARMRESRSARGRFGLNQRVANSRNYCEDHRPQHHSPKKSPPHLSARYSLAGAILLA